MSWTELSDWWLSEVRGDPAYEEVVSPMLVEALGAEEPGLMLDVGSGDGRVMRSLRQLGWDVVGMDLNTELAALSGSVVADGQSLPFGSEAFDGVCCVLTLEHIEDEIEFFREVARVLSGSGVFALVSNHPIWTAPESTPITDVDGEVLWRPGNYFTRGFSEYDAAGRSITFHHRTISGLLNAASDAGLDLEKMIELPHHELVDQAGIPRLAAWRWRKSRPKTTD